MYSKLQDGNFIVCGFVPKDAEMKTTQTGKTLTTWSVKVGEKPSAVEGERGEAIWVSCQAWHDEARVASSRKKGDIALCVGKLQEREYEGKKYKNLVCEFIIKQGAAPTAPATSNVSETANSLSEYEEILSDGEAPF